MKNMFPAESGRFQWRQWRQRHGRRPRTVATTKYI